MTRSNEKNKQCLDQIMLTRPGDDTAQLGDDKTRSEQDQISNHIIRRPDNNKTKCQDHIITSPDDDMIR